MFRAQHPCGAMHAVAVGQLRRARSAPTHHHTERKEPELCALCERTHACSFPAACQTPNPPQSASGQVRPSIRTMRDPGHMVPDSTPTTSQSLKISS